MRLSIVGRTEIVLVGTHGYVELREHLGVSSSYISNMLCQRLLPYGLVRRVKRGWYVAVDRGEL